MSSPTGELQNVGRYFSEALWGVLRMKHAVFWNYKPKTGYEHNIDPMPHGQ
jgi:hypothetical protein